MCCDSSPPTHAPPEVTTGVASGAERGAALAVFDLDRTLTRHDTLLPFVLGYLWRHPARLPRLLCALPLAVRFVLDRDHGALKGAFIRTTLGGASRTSLDLWTRQFVPALLRRGMNLEALRVLEGQRQSGARLLLMSASTDLYVPQIAAALGFDEVICTRVLWREDDRLDGRLASANCRGEEKHRQLAAVIARDAPGRVCAYGDSAADLHHMRLAGEAYLINARRGLRPPAGVQLRRWR
jgi:phosphatidylglycerophosphatase C